VSGRCCAENLRRRRRTCRLSSWRLTRRIDIGRRQPPHSSDENRRALTQWKNEAGMDPVQQQLDAYNARDLEGFVACYAADAVVEDASGQALMSGDEAL